MNCNLCDKVLPNNRRRRCNYCNTKIRRLRTKTKAIEYLGGKCVRCGYEEHPAALQFHHIDPSTKLFTIAEVANKAWSSILSELDKCELLCANCHSIEHSDRTNERFLKELLKYKGNLFGVVAEPGPSVRLKPGIHEFKSHRRH